MATETILLASDGYYTELVPTSGYDHHECVDEDTDPPVLKKEGTQNTSYKKDTFGLSSPIVIDADDVINSVTVYAKCKESNPGGIYGAVNGRLKLMYRLGGTDYVDSAQSLTTSDVVYSKTWTTNNGAAWTLADLNDLECGLQLSATNYSYPEMASAWCRYFYVVIDYTAVEGGGNRVQIVGLW